MYDAERRVSLANKMRFSEDFASMIFCIVTLFEQVWSTMDNTSTTSTVITLPLLPPRRRTFISFERSCFKKTYETNGLTLPVCKTSMNYGTMEPVVSWRLGKLDRQTAEAVKHRYNGILREEPAIPATASLTNSRQLHDSDLCCPTVRAVEKAPLSRRDAHGTTRQIFRIEENRMFQFYHTGRCLPSTSQNQCHGHCIQEISVVFLLVETFDDSDPFSFQPFEIETYCSCKNIGSSPTRKSEAPIAAKSKVRNERVGLDEAKPTTKKTLNTAKDTAERTPTSTKEKLVKGTGELDTTTIMYETQKPLKDKQTTFTAENMPQTSPTAGNSIQASITTESLSTTKRQGIVRTSVTSKTGPRKLTNAETMYPGNTRDPFQTNRRSKHAENKGQSSNYTIP